LVAATIFWASTLIGLSGVITGLTGNDGSVAIIDVFFWTPQGTSAPPLTDKSLIVSDQRNRLRPLFFTPYARNAEQVV
jgi:hypothetical protein